MPKVPNTPPNAKPELLLVQSLKEMPADTKKNGRPKKLKMPPLPEEFWEAMSPLERAHFDFFIQAVRDEHPDLQPSDLICLNMAGLNYINSLRLQQNQLVRRELVTMSRQHPEVQMRAWLDLMSVSRNKRPRKNPEDAERERLMTSLMELSS